MTHLTALQEQHPLRHRRVWRSPDAAPPGERSESASAHRADVGARDGTRSDSTAVPTATPDTSGVTQQINSIDNQLSTIDGQLNAANAGLSTSEGDPSQ